MCNMSSLYIPLCFYVIFAGTSLFNVLNIKTSDFTSHQYDKELDKEVIRMDKNMFSEENIIPC